MLYTTANLTYEYNINKHYGFFLLHLGYVECQGLSQMNFGQQHLNVTQESPSSFVTNWYHHHHLSSILLYMATWLMAPPSLHIRKHGVKRNFSTFFPPTSNNPVITVISVLIALNCVLASPFLFLTALFQALLN